MGCSLNIFFIFLIMSYTARKLLWSSCFTFILASHTFPIVSTLLTHHLSGLISFLSQLLRLSFHLYYRFRIFLPHVRFHSFPEPRISLRWIPQLKTSLKPKPLVCDDMRKAIQVCSLNFDIYLYEDISARVDQTVNLNNSLQYTDEAHCRAMAEPFSN